MSLKFLWVSVRKRRTTHTHNGQTDFVACCLQFRFRNSLERRPFWKQTRNFFGCRERTVAGLMAFSSVRAIVHNTIRKKITKRKATALALSHIVISMAECVWKRPLLAGGCAAYWRSPCLSLSFVKSDHGYGVQRFFDEDFGIIIKMCVCASSLANVILKMRVFYTKCRVAILWFSQYFMSAFIFSLSLLFVFLLVMVGNWMAACEP